MCGVISITGTPYASYETHKALFTLQHRGQDASGILSYDFENKKFYLEKSLGLVSSVFSREKLETLKGTIAIGHVRYSTVGSGGLKDSPPHLTGYPFGIGMAHNGNLVNYHTLCKKLKTEYRYHILTGNDGELIQSLFSIFLAKSLDKEKVEGHLSINDLLPAVTGVLGTVKGGYSVVGVIAGHGLVAFRDPSGIRPLVFGKRKLSSSEKEEMSLKHNWIAPESYCLASESVALNYLEYDLVRDVAPGELIFIHNDGTVKSAIINQNKSYPCMFEWIYFSGPESTIQNRPVYDVRLNFGTTLGKRIKAEIEASTISPDIVVPIPDTSRIAAISLAEEIGVPYRELLVKNRYIQRSFILKSQEDREQAVDLKLAPILSGIKGKKVLLVDDSIVRGTTSKKIIQIVRNAGASEIYIASTCPPVRFPCFYGIDIADADKLLANNKTLTQIADQIHADRVYYTSIEDIGKCIGLENICKACLDGQYPIDVSEGLEFSNIRKKDLQKMEIP